MLLNGEEQPWSHAEVQRRHHDGDGRHRRRHWQPGFRLVRLATASVPTASPLEYPVIRHMNNLESVYTYEGTNEILTVALRHAITGLAAYR